MWHFESVKIFDCYVSCHVANAFITGGYTSWYRKQRHFAQLPQSQATFTRYRTNFRPVETFDRTFSLCSHGNKQTRINFCQWFLPTAHAQSTTLPAEVFTPRWSNFPPHRLKNRPQILEIEFLNGLASKVWDG